MIFERIACFLWIVCMHSFGNIAKIEFWIKSARKESSGCRLLTQLSDFHFKVKLVFSLSPRIFHFQNLKMCSPVNQIIPSDLCPRLGWKKDEGDSWHNYQAFTSYWRGGKWGERKPNFISSHLPQYLSAQGWCWISRKSKHMWAIRAF